MNDGLREAIEKTVRIAFTTNHRYVEGRVYPTAIAAVAAEAARAWLALPPSEEEIDAATDAVMRDYALFRDPRYGTELVRREVVEILTVALVASRAVLVRPPEERGR